MFHNNFKLYFANYFLVFLVLTYPLMYFAYKYNLPKPNSADIYHYLRMYITPLDFSVADGPFVYRQISAIFVKIVTNLGIYYDATISFSDPAFTQEIYFAAIFVNWLSLVFSAAILSAYYLKRTTAPFAVVIAGLPSLLLFFQYGIIFHGLSESTDGLSVCLAILCFVAYSEKRIYLFALFIFLAVFQRELILILFAFLSLYDLVRIYSIKRAFDRRLILLFLIPFLACILHLMVRAFIFPDLKGQHDYQFSIVSIWEFIWGSGKTSLGKSIAVWNIDSSK